MNIKVNGSQTDIEATTLAELVVLLGYEKDAKIATALNGDFIPASKRQEQRLHDHDEVEIVAPRQGG